MSLIFSYIYIQYQIDQINGNHYNNCLFNLILNITTNAHNIYIFNKSLYNILN